LLKKHQNLHYFSCSGLFQRNSSCFLLKSAGKSKSFLLAQLSIVPVGADILGIAVGLYNPDRSKKHTMFYATVAAIAKKLGTRVRACEFLPIGNSNTLHIVPDDPAPPSM
jgi:hypothetical protein